MGSEGSIVIIPQMTDQNVKEMVKCLYSFPVILTTQSTCKAQALHSNVHTLVPAIALVLPHKVSPAHERS